MARRSNRLNGQDDSEDENSNSGSDTPDTDTTVAFTNARNKRRGRGRSKRFTKRQRIVVNGNHQEDSDDDGSPQPSTSRINMSPTQVNGIQNCSDKESSDSGEESPDSDNMPVDDDRDVNTKVSSIAAATKRTRSQQKATRCSPRVKRKKPNDATNGIKDSSKKGAHRLSSMLQTLNLSNKSSRGSQAKDAFDSKVVESMAQKCVYFLLIEDQKKHAIKRKGIVQNIFKDEAYTPKFYTAVIHKANQILKKIYGMELMELENQKDSYLIVNILKREYGVEDYVELPRIKHQQHGLILYLLTIIFMNDNCITEDELVKALKCLGLDFFSKKPHPVFGDIKKYISIELVKQMYLNYECINKDPPQYEITWGLRAKEEIDKRDLLQFACKIMDDTSPENWILQYKDAEESASPE